jgi:3-oxoacyl-[acyl-carrier protein] reductase
VPCRPSSQRPGSRQVPFRQCICVQGARPRPGKGWRGGTAARPGHTAVSSFTPFEPAALAGKVVLVTGAAGGIGGAVARRFAGLGAHLVLADRNAAALERLITELNGPEPLCWAGDLTIEPDVRLLFSRLLERFGRVDVAVNAAGVLRVQPLEDITKQEWDQVLDANAGSAFLVCRECCGPMRRQRSGRIINFSSLAGQTGGILAGAHYAAAKAAVISLTRSVAKLLAPYGARCNAIAPSGVETEMLGQFTEEQVAALRSGIPVGRFGIAAEMAELVLWLSSPASDYITGQTININGGAYLG